jgi:site-specific DNA recombinase
MLYRGICKRKMQAQHNNSRVYYRCRYAKEYALASHVNHPVNVYLREERLLPLVDDWLLKLFAPHRVRETIRQLAAAQPEPPRTPPRLMTPTPSSRNATPSSRATRPPWTRAPTR